MKYSFIQLRFLCSAESPKEEDHIINIKKNGNEYMWIWRDEVKHRVQTLWLTKDELKARLQMTIDLMEFDDDPYASVQVFLPAMPTVLISTDRLAAAFETLWRSFEQCFENWPENMPMSEALKWDTDDVEDDEEYEAEDEADEDEEDDEEVEEGEIAEDDEEDDYADMPGLISQEEEAEFQRFCRWLKEKENKAVTPEPPRTPERPKREPCCPPAPRRSNRVTNQVITRTVNGNRVHTYFS